MAALRDSDSVVRSWQATAPSHPLAGHGRLSGCQPAERRGVKRFAGRVWRGRRCTYGRHTRGRGAPTGQQNTANDDGTILCADGDIADHNNRISHSPEKLKSIFASLALAAGSVRLACAAAAGVVVVGAGVAMLLRPASSD